MPTHFDQGEAPVVRFDVLLEVSPFFLFRRLKEAEEDEATASPLLVDVRQPGSDAGATPPSPLSLAGAIPWEGEAWEPPQDRLVVLFDEAGSRAVEIAGHYQQRGFPQVKALFGGLELYEFSLDPEVVGAETFLVRNPRSPG